ncbi:MAG: hypothetical protein RIQ56_459 [Candidatus Parcubacteria bacterium]|jgi:signal peptidase I
MAIFFRPYLFRIMLSIIAIVIIFAVFRPYIVTGGSMSPTFQTGDKLLIERISPVFRSLHRGDVVVIRDPRTAGHPIILKRIVGLPNEEVSVDYSGVKITFPDGTTSYFDSSNAIGGTQNGGIWTMKLGPEDYYVMGDNRSNSTDSRHWGTIQPHEMIGRPVLRLYPFNRISFIF